MRAGVRVCVCASREANWRKNLNTPKGSTDLDVSSESQVGDLTIRLPTSHDATRWITGWIAVQTRARLDFGLNSREHVSGLGHNIPPPPPRSLGPLPELGIGGSEHTHMPTPDHQQNFKVKRRTVDKSGGCRVSIYYY